MTRTSAELHSVVSGCEAREMAASLGISMRRENVVGAVEICIYFSDFNDVNTESKEYKLLEVVTRKRLVETVTDWEQ
jgi:hypothetical protein